MRGEIIKMNNGIDSQFYEAVGQGNYARAKDLLSQGGDVNFRGFCGRTSLMVACEHNQKKIIELLLQHNADVNLKDNCEETALMYAADCGNFGVMKSLLACGADLSCRNCRGETAFVKLLEHKKLSFEDIRFFVEAGADVVTPDSHGITPLGHLFKGVYTYEPEKMKIYRYLIEHGANPNVKNKQDKSLLDLTVHSDKEEDDSIFLIEHGADCTNINLVEIVRDKKFKLAKILIKDCLTANSADISGVTVAMSAAETGNLEMLEYLVDLGANVEDEDKMGNTLMMFAAKGGNVDVIKFLEKKNINIHKPNVTGDTPFIQAAIYEKTDALIYLAAHGADINHQNEDGDTALILAATEGDEEVVETLISLGVDITIKNDEGATAYLAAAFNQEKEVIEYFHEAGLIQYNSEGHQKKLNEDVEQELKSRTVEQLMALPKEEPALWRKTIALKKLSVLVQLLPTKESLKMYETAQDMLQPTEKETVQQLIRSKRESEKC